VGIILREKRETRRLPAQDTRFYNDPLNEVVDHDHSRIDHGERQPYLTE